MVIEELFGQNQTGVPDGTDLKTHAFRLGVTHTQPGVLAPVQQAMILGQARSTRRTLTCPSIAFEKPIFPWRRKKRRTRGFRDTCLTTSLVMVKNRTTTTLQESMYRIPICG
jgi:hypothetical protein